MTAKSKKILKLTLNILLSIFLICVVILFGNILISRAMGKVPRIFGYSFHVVETPSMHPTIKVNDLVIAKKVDKSSIHENDIIVFVSPHPNDNKKMIVHRVISINPDGTFVTKGDNAPDQDFYPASDIVGLVTAVNTPIGAFLSFFTHHNYIIFIVIFALLALVIITEIVRIIREVNRQKLEKAKNDLLDELSNENLEQLQQKYKKLSDEQNKSSDVHNNDQDGI